MTYLAKTLKHNTIKCYLSAVKHLHLKNNLPLRLESFERLQYIMRGIRRSQGDSEKVRKPITPAHLQLFYQLLQPGFANNADNKMIWAAICLAFFGFLRVSEFTSSPTSEENKTLTPADCSFNTVNNQEIMHIRLKSSKTDPFLKGTTLTIGGTDHEICPVTALREYLAIRGTARGPLFMYKSGKSLSQQLFTREVRFLLSKGGLDEHEFAGHSFRIGAATAAAAANVPTWLIKALRRWSSDCFERYVRTPDSTFAQASRNILQLKD